ncbi:MAG: strawberry notch family protein [Proteobacteria bacterium]|nr:PLxRFG domain-containing protein [Desulfobulbaceae bacterium]MBU4151595.1 strawberry notch family protein [Pseudomonadota bacterium]
MAGIIDLFDDIDKHEAQNKPSSSQQVVPAGESKNDVFSLFGQIDAEGDRTGGPSLQDGILTHIGHGLAEGAYSNKESFGAGLQVAGERLLDTRTGPTTRQYQEMMDKGQIAKEPISAITGRPLSLSRQQAPIMSAVERLASSSDGTLLPQFKRETEAINKGVPEWDWTVDQQSKAPYAPPNVESNNAPTPVTPSIGQNVTDKASLAVSEPLVNEAKLSPMQKLFKENVSQPVGEALIERGMRIEQGAKEKLAENPQWQAPEEIRGLGILGTINKYGLFSREAGVALAHDVASNIPQVAATTGLAIAGGLTGNPLLAGIGVGSGIAATGPLEAGGAFQEMVAAGVKPEEAARSAVLVGAVNSALEMSEIGILFERIPGLKHIFQSELAKEATREGLMKRVGKAALTTGITEGFEEGAQQIVTNTAKRVYDQQQDLLGDVGESMFVGGILGALTGGLAGVKRSEAQHRIDFLTKLDPSQLSQLTPENSEFSQSELNEAASISSLNSELNRQRNERVLTLKKANIPTPDLIALADDPEKLKALNINREDVSTVIAEKHEDLSKAMAFAGPLGKAVNATELQMLMDHRVIEEEKARDEVYVKRLAEELAGGQKQTPSTEPAQSVPIPPVSSTTQAGKRSEKPPDLDIGPINTVSKSDESTLPTKEVQDSSFGKQPKAFTFTSQEAAEKALANRIKRGRAAEGELEVNKVDSGFQINRVSIDKRAEMLIAGDQSEAQGSDLMQNLTDQSMSAEDQAATRKRKVDFKKLSQEGQSSQSNQEINSEVTPNELPMNPESTANHTMDNGGELANPGEDASPVLAVDGEHYDLPGGKGLLYTVTKNVPDEAQKTGEYAVTIFDPKDDSGLSKVVGHGDTEQAAYDRAVALLKPEHRPAVVGQETSNAEEAIPENTVSNQAQARKAELLAKAFSEDQSTPELTDRERKELELLNAGKHQEWQAEFATEDEAANTVTVNATPPEKTQAREPWQMTRREFQVQEREKGNQPLLAGQQHLNAVAAALGEGKPVPQQVIDHYGIERLKDHPQYRAALSEPIDDEDRRVELHKTIASIKAHPSKSADGRRDQARALKDAESALKRIGDGMLTAHGAVQVRGKVADSKLVKLWLEGLPHFKDYHEYSEINHGEPPITEAHFNQVRSGENVSGDEKSEQEKNKARLLDNRRKRLIEQLTNPTTDEEKADIQAKIDKLAQFVTKSDAEKIPPASDTSKPAEDKRQITCRNLESVLHTSLATDQEVMEIAGKSAVTGDGSGFSDTIDGIIVARINKLIEAAESPQARELYAGMIVSGKPVLPKSFYQSLQKQAAKNFRQQQKEANRDPEVYQEAIREAYLDGGLDEGTDEAKEFKAGFDHALKGKTKSTLPQGKENYAKGYEAARKWIKIDQGRDWYEGKKGEKQKSTGEALRRHWEQLKKGLDDLSADDMDKTWKQIVKATTRADLFSSDVLADDATPGAKEWLALFRNQVFTFPDFFTEQAAGFKTRKGRNRMGPVDVFKGNWTSSSGRFANVETNDERIKEARAIALEYQTKVSELAKVFEGVNSLSEIESRLKNLFKVENPEAGYDGKLRDGYAHSQFYKENSRTLFAGIDTLIPEELGGYTNRYSAWGKLVETENKERQAADRKTPLTRPRLDTIVRTGVKDSRNGRDITPEELKKTFGFADITIGDYVKAQEAKDHLNYTYDALMTMAELFGAEPKALSFGGRLHFAIGALGHGKYAAHFSYNHPTADGRTVPVINVTNTRGDGALFHEFIHAIDWLTEDSDLRKAIADIKKLLKKTPASPSSLLKNMRRFIDGSRFTNMDKGSTPKDHARYAIEHYYRYPEKGGNQTKFYKDALKMDAAGSEKGYWAKEHELLARAGESWALDTLSQDKKRDDYLVSDWAEDGKVTPPKYRGTPYPGGDERKNINQLLSLLIRDNIVWGEKGPKLNPDGEWKKSGGPAKAAEDAYEAARQAILDDFDAIYDQMLAEANAEKRDRNKAYEDAAVNKILGDPEGYGLEGFAPTDEQKGMISVIDYLLINDQAHTSTRWNGKITRDSIAAALGESAKDWLDTLRYVGMVSDRVVEYPVTEWHVTDLGRYLKLEYENRVGESSSVNDIALSQGELSIPNEETTAENEMASGEAYINDSMTSEELEQVFDEAVAEMEEEKQEQPEQEPPGATIEKQGWSAEDFQEIVQHVASGKVVLLADRSVGLPTIHDLPTGSTQHLGYGVFKTVTPEYEAHWSGGGAMPHTPSGKAYTIVDLRRGALPFDLFETNMVLDVINEKMGLRQEPTPKFSSGLKAGDVVTVRPHSDLWNMIIDGRINDETAYSGQKVRRVTRDIDGYEYIELENEAKTKGEYLQKMDDEPAFEPAKAPLPSKREPGTPSLNDVQLETAQELAKKMAKHGVEGIDEALKGLVAIFAGGPNKLQSFPAGFDEESYKAAKPHFEAAAKAFAKAGQSFKEFIKLFFKELVTMFGPGVRPYAIQFAKDYESEYGKVPGSREDENIPTAIDPSNLPQNKLADWVSNLLKGGTSFTWRDLFAKADDAFDGTQGEGKYSVKDAYDAMELGINKYLLGIGFGNYSYQFQNDDGVKSAVETAKRLEAMLSQVPTQTKRTKEQDEFQQFSTPPHYAYLANWVANVNKNDTMLEPSAGIGGLAVFAKMAGAKVIVNELSARRMEFLSQLPFDQFFAENAEHLSNILPQSVQPTVIVMNPPFSSTAGRVEGERKTMNGAKHVEQALKKLQSGGRLVAIVGGGMSAESPTFRDWWAKIKKEYNVRANLLISGDSYVKYGTTFDNRILVIDKQGPTPDSTQIVTGSVESPLQAFAKLAEIRRDRPEVVTKPTAIPPTSPEEEQRPEQKPATGRGGGRGTKTNLDQKTEANAPEPSDEETIETPTEQPEIKLEDTASNGVVKKELGNSTFEEYEPQKVKIEGAHSHNTPLVESAALASVASPDPTYTPNLPEEIITKGLLSAAQLEAVVYAGQAFAQKLPDERRRGFFIGDGTGVGKGRQISAVIMDSLRSGQKKAVWISMKNPLIEDARRDFADIGGDPKVIFPQAGTKTLDTIDRKKNGILFTAYSTIIGNSKSSNEAIKKGTKGQGSSRDRILQISHWLGEDFDGVIAFDEAHAMGNLIPVKGKRGSSKPTLTALAGQDLRNIFPKAKILYVSATGATEVSNLAYADRLGLWGEGTSFSNAPAFIGEMSKSVSAMEMVAQNLKQMGLYLARSLSYNGIEYSKIEHELTSYQNEAYDAMAEAWQVVLNNINEALKATGVLDEDGKGAGGRSSGEIKGRVMSAFWGSHQRFFNQIITASAMPSVLEQIDNDLQGGKSVVIQLTNTNEADQSRALAKLAGQNLSKEQENGEEEIEEFDLTPRDQLLTLLDNAFPIYQYEEVSTVNENGVTSKSLQLVLDSNGNPVINQEALAMKNELVEKIKGMKIPDSALQMLVNHFGPDKISEVTGRSKRVVIGENGKITVEKRSPAIVAADAKGFNDGMKRILVFSQAGGTGFSFHSDKRFKNQEQRVHYIVQPGWSADKAVQGFGRTHRTNQKHAPVYRLVATDVPAQKRFISSIARRLEQLGALTSGQRDTAGGSIFNASDNLESRYAVQAVNQFFTNLAMGKRGQIVPGYDLFPDDLLEQMGLTGVINAEDNSLNTSKIPPITQFLNRMLSLRVDTQKQVFEIFSDEIDKQVAYAKQNGTFDDGLQTIRHRGAMVTNRATVYEDKSTNVKAEYVEVKYKTDNPFYQFDDVVNYIRNKREAGWFKNKRSGRVSALWSAGTRTTKDGSIVPVYGFYRTSGISFEAASEVKPESFERLEANEAAKLWEEENKVRPQFATHKINLITGGILPIWNRFNNDRIDSARIQTDDGRVYMGREIKSKDLEATLANLNVQSSEAMMRGHDLVQAVIDGARVVMSNGATIHKAMVSGERRIELTLKTYPNRAQELFLARAGVITERIQYRDRYFIPNNVTPGGVVLSAVMKSFNINATKVEYGNEDGDGVKASRAHVGWSGLLPEDIWGELGRGQYNNVASRLRDSRALQLVTNEEELPPSAAPLMNVEDRIVGAYDSGSDTMYLVSSAIESGQAVAAMLHEGFHRANVRGDFAKVIEELGRMEKMARRGTGELPDWFSAAMAAAQVDINTPHYLEEIGAYAVQQNPNEQPPSIKRWVNTMLAKAKAALVRVFGLRVGKVDMNLLREIAATGLRASRVRSQSSGNTIKLSRTRALLSPQDVLDTIYGKGKVQVKGIPAEKVEKIDKHFDKDLADTAKGMIVSKRYRPDTTIIARIFSTIEHYGDKIPAFKRYVEAVLSRSERKHELEVHILGADTEADFIKVLSGLEKEDKKAYDRVMAYLIRCDRNAKGFRLVRDKQNNTWSVIDPGGKAVETGLDEDSAVYRMIDLGVDYVREQGFSEKEVNAWKVTRVTLNRGFDIMAAQMRRIIEEARDSGQEEPKVSIPVEPKPWAIVSENKDVAIALFESRQEAMLVLQDMKKHKEATEALAIIRRSGEEMAKDPISEDVSLSTLLAKMGDLRGTYMPRIREAGGAVLVAKKEGANPIRENFDAFRIKRNANGSQEVVAIPFTPLAKRAKELAANGYKVELRKNENLGEDVFSAARLVASTEAILKTAEKKSTGPKTGDNEYDRAVQEINKGINMAVADIFKGRGFRGAMIARKEAFGEHVWIGYEEDLLKSVVQYANSMAGGIAKRDTARDMVLAITGRDIPWSRYKAEQPGATFSDYLDMVNERRIDPATQKNAYHDVMHHMEEFLRNDEAADRMFGILKGLTALKFMGFRVSSAAVNLTNMVMAVPATMSGIGKIPYVKTWKFIRDAVTAYGAYRLGQGIAEDREVFHEISEKGWDEAQYNHDAAKVLQSKLGRGWDKFMAASMAMFGATEKVNRATTIFAAYKGIRATNKTMLHEEAMRLAKEVSDKAHGVYGKETLPYWAQGKGPGQMALRSAYTFGKFSHNYLLTMIDLGFDKKAVGSMLHMLIAPSLLAGVGANAITPIVAALLKALGGWDDPEEELYSWADKEFGGGEWMRSGLFGLGGAGVNLKASLGINVAQPPSSLKELLGAPFAVITDEVQGASMMAHGDVMKGVEKMLPTGFGNPLRAYREGTEGVTTSGGAPVFYGTKPLKGTATDAVFRFFSFNPARMAAIKETQWSEKKIAGQYSDKRHEIYTAYRRFYMLPEEEQSAERMAELVLMVSEYNARVKSKGLSYIKPISGRDVAINIRRTFKAPKREMLREVNE